MLSESVKKKSCDYAPMITDNGRIVSIDCVAQIDRSIALETQKFGATASGTLDFRNETLDLSIKPQVREGIPIQVPQVAELVRFRGPFRSPAVGIDAGITSLVTLSTGEPASPSPSPSASLVP